LAILIISIILLFIASSYFSGSETALTATNEMKLQLKSANGDKKATRLLKLVNNPDLFIPGILIANNVLILCFLHWLLLWHLNMVGILA
jgi:Mg2+/Co2+ transporter CorB